MYIHKNRLNTLRTILLSQRLKMALRRGTISLIRACNNKGKYAVHGHTQGLVLQQQIRLVSQAMEDAKKRVTLLTEDPGNDVKLKMYALFKQVQCIFISRNIS